MKLPNVSEFARKLVKGGSCCKTFSSLVTALGKRPPPRVHGLVHLCDQGRLHKKIAGGETSQKGTKDTILTSYPGTDLGEHWGCVFEILEFTKGTNSGSLTISGRGGQEQIMQQYKRMGVFELSGTIVG